MKNDYRYVEHKSVRTVTELRLVVDDPISYDTDRQKAMAFDLLGALQRFIQMGERPDRERVAGVARSIGLTITVGGRHIALQSRENGFGRFAIIVGTYGDWI